MYRQPVIWNMTLFQTCVHFLLGVYLLHFLHMVFVLLLFYRWIEKFARNSCCNKNIALFPPIQGYAKNLLQLWIMNSQKNSLFMSKYLQFQWCVSFCCFCKTFSFILSLFYSFPITSLRTVLPIFITLTTFAFFVAKMPPKIFKLNRWTPKFLWPTYWKNERSGAVLFNHTNVIPFITTS